MRHEVQVWPDLRAKLELVFGGVPAIGQNCICEIARLTGGTAVNGYWNASTNAWQGLPVSNPMTETLSGFYQLLVPEIYVDYAQGVAGYIVKVECVALNIMEYIHVVHAPDAWRELRSDYTAAGTFGEGVNVQQVNTGAIVSGSYAAGAIDAAAIATDAIDADAIATDAFGDLELSAGAAQEIADAILDEPMAGHTTGGTLGDFITRMLALRQQNNRVVYSAWNSAGVPTAATVYIYASKSDMDADAGGTGVGSIGSYTIAATFDGSLRPTVYTSGKVS